MTPIDPEDLLVLLEDGPKTVTQLASWLRQPVPAVLAELRRLARDGRVHRDGPQRLWGLAFGYVPGTVERRLKEAAERLRQPAATDPSAAMPAGSADVEASIPELHDDVVDPDLDGVDDEFFEEPVRKPAGRQRTLRQVKAPSQTGPSWWEGLSREDLSREAQARRSGMSGSREARFIHGMPR